MRIRFVLMLSMCSSKLSIILGQHPISALKPFTKIIANNKLLATIAAVSTFGNDSMARWMNGTWIQLRVEIFEGSLRRDMSCSVEGSVTQQMLNAELSRSHGVESNPKATSGMIKANPNTRLGRRIDDLVLGE